MITRPRQSDRARKTRALAGIAAFCALFAAAYARGMRAVSAAKTTAPAAPLATISRASAAANARGNHAVATAHPTAPAARLATISRASAAAKDRGATSPTPRAQTGTPPNVVVLGIDGMDPRLLEGFVARGLMPHFARLMQEGNYRHLGTSTPPQSPVAWSNFITGMDPGGHGIFDFIHRNPKTYAPLFSAALVTEPTKTVTIGSLVIPLSHGKTTLLRKGTAFWQVLGAHDIARTVFRIPANFPPAPGGGRTLSGMGTPDLLGTYGTFGYYTDDNLYDGIHITGGALYPIAVRDGHVEAALVGPPNSLRKGRPTLHARFTVDIDTKNNIALFTVDGRQAIVRAGQWSPWLPVRFPLLGRLKSLSGIVRFYVRSLSPHVNIYATPININPAHPALPISTPKNYASELYRRIGYYYTQGMPEDTKALEYGMLDDAEFVAQTDIVLDERWKMLRSVLDDYRGGFLFFYVSTIDQSCHVLWRNMDPKHPAHTPSLKFADRIERLYVQMDSMLALVQSRIPDNATLIVMSDHGFAPYYYKVNLNTWLYRNGYLALLDPGEMGQHAALTNVFWRRTRAYGLGINGLYINQLGREGRGTVEAGAASRALVREIREKLLAWIDPATGQHVVTAAFVSDSTYHGPEAHHGPDIVVGYNRGYRCSDESALGTLTQRIITPNLGKWSGDHCMDPHRVPGILLSNRAIAAKRPRLRDLTVTILRLYGIAPPAVMRGHDVFAR